VEGPRNSSGWTRAITPATIKAARSRRGVRAVPRPIGVAFADPAAIAAARAKTSWLLSAPNGPEQGAVSGPPGLLGKGRSPGFGVILGGSGVLDLSPPPAVSILVKRSQPQANSAAPVSVNRR
jgi:hypothetical protein